MSAASYVQLLGRPRVKVGAAWQPFLPDKRFWLLALLACSEDGLGREQLSSLFWPEVGSAEARHNLRQLLQRVKRLGWADALETERHGLRWPIESDVAAFRRALEEGELAQALSLYGGPLLAGLESYDASELTTWLELERAQLGSEHRAAALRHADALEAAGQHREAAQLLLKLLAQDALDEDALRAYMGAAARDERAGEALAAYRRFAEALVYELALAPAPETERLARALQAGEAPSAAALAPPSASLPPAVGTSFIGRELELGEILNLLAQPSCRLLTLVGHGGVGKTRLAQQALEHLGERFPDGLAYAPLEALASPAGLPASLARAVGLELAPQADALSQVAAHLGVGRWLLVLDNLEHLLGGVLLLRELLARCPGLKLLVTSRAPLELSEEWLLNVQGLPFPERGEAFGSASRYEAVHLFETRARQVRPDFTLTPETLPDVADICQTLDGSPLGIELAAVWVRMMPAHEIAREVRTSLDLLTSAGGSVPERHQSLRAAFEHSWRLLAPAEQQGLRRLAAFRGGFTRRAAAQVAGAGSLLLAALVGKSLVRPDFRGRYDRHPLLYQFTQEKFAGDPDAPRVLNRHAEYFLALAQRTASAAAEPKPLEAVGDDLENLAAAWRWAVAAGWADALRDSAGPLSEAFSSRPHEVLPLLQDALALVQGLPAHELALRLALGPPLMVVKGYAAPELKENFGRAHALCEEVPDGPHLFPALWGLWGHAMVRGECIGALELAQACLRAAQAAGDPALLAEAHRNLEENYLWLGEFALAREHLEQALALGASPLALPFFLRGHDPRVTMRASGAHTLWMLGYPERALELSREAVAVAQANRHPNDLALALVFAALLAAMRRDLEAAEALGEQLVAAGATHRSVQLEGVGRLCRGWALGAQGPEQGLSELKRGVALWRGTGAALFTPIMNALLAEAYARLGRRAEALEALELALAHSDALGERWWDAELHRLRGTLLPPDEAEAAFALSLQTARRQGAKALEQRTAESLMQHRGSR